MCRPRRSAHRPDRAAPHCAARGDCRGSPTAPPRGFPGTHCERWRRRDGGCALLLRGWSGRCSPLRLPPVRARAARAVRGRSTWPTCALAIAACLRSEWFSNREVKRPSRLWVTCVTWLILATDEPEYASSETEKPALRRGRIEGQTRILLLHRQRRANIQPAGDVEPNGANGGPVAESCAERIQHVPGEIARALISQTGEDILGGHETRIEKCSGDEVRSREVVAHLNRALEQTIASNRYGDSLQAHRGGDAVLQGLRRILLSDDHRRHSPVTESAHRIAAGEKANQDR